MIKRNILILALSILSLTIFSQQKCNYYGVIFDSIVDFSDIKFYSKSDFTRAQFKLTTVFNRAQFYSDVSFHQSKFFSTVDFVFANFDSVADFARTPFYYNANFRFANFNFVTFFSGAHFYSFANFRQTNFFSGSGFLGAVFDSTVIFSEANFRETANFQLAQFHGDVNFHMSKFDLYAIFAGAQFYSSVDFSGAQLPMLIDMSDVRIINKEIDFTGSKVNEKYGTCKIYLINSNIDKIKFRYSRFELDFHNVIDPDVITSVYDKLLAKQQKEGFISSYEKLDKEYKEFKYKQGIGYNKTWGLILNWLDKYWWGYGYDKELIIRNTFFLFLLFTILNWIGYSHMLQKVYENPKLMELRNNLRYKNKLIIYLKIFPQSAFYTGLIFFGIKFNINNLKYKENLSNWGIFNLVYFFLIYLSGLVCLGYLVNFILSG